MKEYLNHKVDEKDPDLISAIDDLPLWSAPFGLRLLEIIELRKNINVLDIGCGTGFPIVELSQRLGGTCNIYGIDPWKESLERVKLKIRVYDIKNLKVFGAAAEEMPFENDFFDLVVSNNGINNVQDLSAALKETNRICRAGAQFVFSMNTDKTMHEFYTEFEKVLVGYDLSAETLKMKDQIYSKRKPQAEMENYLDNSGFIIKDVFSDSFKLRFTDATAMFNHHLIKFWFLNGWKNILKEKDVESVFEKVERNMNSKSEKSGYCELTIPFLVFNCQKK